MRLAQTFPFQYLCKSLGVQSAKPAIFQHSQRLGIRHTLAMLLASTQHIFRQRSRCRFGCRRWQGLCLEFPWECMRVRLIKNGIGLVCRVSRKRVSGVWIPIRKEKEERANLLKRDVAFPCGERRPSLCLGRRGRENEL